MHDYSVQFYKGLKILKEEDVWEQELKWQYMHVSNLGFEI